MFWGCSDSKGKGETWLYRIHGCIFEISADLILLSYYYCGFLTCIEQMVVLFILFGMEFEWLILIKNDNFGLEFGTLQTYETSLFKNASNEIR